MLRTIDRYVIREMLAPFAIVLLVFTFMLLMGPIMDVADKLIAKGVAWSIVLRVLPTLLPQALALTIPMALLVALLISLGRLSEDREWVALQACGVSAYRLVRPIAIIAVLGLLVTGYVMIWALPDANQAYREIVYPVLISNAQTAIKPRVFFQGFPPRVLYLRDIDPDGTWKDVFLYDRTEKGVENVYVAPRGRLEADPQRRLAQFVLDDFTQHQGTADAYKVNHAKGVQLTLDPETVFPRQTIMRSYAEKTVTELNADIEDLKRRNLPAVEEPMYIQQKFSIPVACLVFAIIGLALGVSSGREGKMASFIVGIGVIFAYYVLMYGAASAAKALIIPPWSARWVPNVILGPLGIGLLVWRARFSERELRFGWLSRLPWRRGESVPGRRGDRHKPSLLARAKARLPHHWIPRPRILDWYISRLYVKVVGLTIGGLLLIFYIAEFIDLSDKVFKGTAKPAMVFLYYVFKTPNFIYFIIPLAGLIAALVTFGLLTRNSELVVMKACGISLYRAAVPLLVFALLSGALLFVLEEDVLPTANRRWKTYRSIFTNVDPERAEMLNRGWIVSQDGRSIYHFDAYRPETPQSRGNLYQMSVYTFDPQRWRLAAHWSAALVTYSPALSAQRGAPVWTARNGWAREFPLDAPAGLYTTFGRREMRLEAPTYFGNEQPDAERMNYFQLRRYIDTLRAGGFKEPKAAVELQRKIAFPFVTLVMTLIAVPFAVTMGKRGAMYGIGLGVVLAIMYWVTAQVFAAFGVGGVLPPSLAAWAPNILFGAGAVYLVLTVRT